MKERGEPEWLFSARWVHAFEEDTEKGSVYRPETARIPLSRRPRERLELRRDGSASVFLPGADDRMIEQRAKWTLEDGEIVVRVGAGEMRITASSKTRLLVQTR
jgi:hypothetical protein